MMDEWGPMGDLARGVVEATEEAVLNSLVAAKTMGGRDGHTVQALPIEEVQNYFNDGDLPSTRD
jgi:D-aminopeptidase